MTITVPTENTGELAVFDIELLQSFEEAVENIGLLVKPSDVLIGERAGWWRVL